MTSPTFLEGLYETRGRTREAIAGGANVFMLGRGMARQVIEEFTPATSLALMLSASAAGRPQGAVVTPIGSVDEALRLGADAVVVYVALAGENESEMLQYASSFSEGIPPPSRVRCAGSFAKSGAPAMHWQNWRSKHETGNQSLRHWRGRRFAGHEDRAAGCLRYRRCQCLCCI